MLGILAGVFFGELVGFLSVVGDAFILLLQMSVLPYVAVSLIVGLGRLSREEAVSLARHAGISLLVLWAITLSVMLMVPLAFPDWESASFFSTALVEERPSFDFIALFIPANPFRSLAESVVPAVVVFSIALGLALIAINRKEGLIRGLAALTEAIGSIAGFVMRVAPLGVFAIAANAAGTMDVEQLQGLQVYVAITVALATLLAFWTLPVLVTTLTHFRYGEIMRSVRGALITAFATGNLFVVLSVLSERSKELVQSGRPEDGDSARLAEVLVPTAYNLPTSGKLLSLGFVLFAGWLTGNDISLAEYPTFVAAGLASFFGSTLVAVPFLLDLFRIPADTFELFIVSDNVIVNRFGALLAAMFIVTLTLLTVSAAEGRLVIRWKQILRYAALTVGLTLLTIGGVRGIFEATGREYQGYHLFVDRGLLEPGVKATVLDAPPDPLPGGVLEALERRVEGRTSALERTAERGLLRVGYYKDWLPYAFRNPSGELVGFDVEMFHRMARDLRVALEFVRVDRRDAVRLLDAGYLDIAMGRVITPETMRETAFSAPYLDETEAFIVRDYRRREFSSRASLQKLEGLRIAIGSSPYYLAKLRRLLPDAELIEIQSPREFFTDTSGRFDAMYFAAAAGSAWSMVYPAYAVAVPQPDVVRVPLAYPLAHGDPQMVDFVNGWLGLKQKDGTIRELFNYWMEGKEQKRRKPRWSVIRDVLHWVE